IASYIHSLTHQLITTYSTASSRVSMDIAITDIFLTITTAIPCGLIINELVSNALKHAFPQQREGTITVSITPSNKDSLILTVSDTGIGFPEGIDFRNTDTLGMQLVNSLVEQLEGTITLDRSKGTRVRIEFRKQE
ncbi:MAG: ATP-binding protein, partial [Desulfobacteraceae bacterium]|nr:ATP-binding protein [Desulfobacteraceae bacterium]